MDESSSDLLLALLARAEAARGNTNTIVWTTVSIFAAANAVLLQAFAEAFQYDRPVALSLSFVGLVASAFGCHLVHRGLQFLAHQEGILRNLELRLQVPKLLQLTWDPPQPPDKMTGIGAKFLLRLFSLLTILGWALAMCLVAVRATSVPTFAWVAVPVFLVIAAVVGNVTSALCK